MAPALAKQSVDRSRSSRHLLSSWVTRPGVLVGRHARSGLVTGASRFLTGPDIWIAASNVVGLTCSLTELRASRTRLFG
jgi:hypothetical protein